MPSLGQAASPLCPFPPHLRQGSRPRATTPTLWTTQGRNARWDQPELWRCGQPDLGWTTLGKEWARDLGFQLPRPALCFRVREGRPLACGLIGEPPGLACGARADKAGAGPQAGVRGSRWHSPSRGQARRRVWFFPEACMRTARACYRQAAGRQRAGSGHPRTGRRH